MSEWKISSSLVYRLTNWFNQPHRSDVIEEAQELMTETAEALKNRAAEVKALQKELSAIRLELMQNKELAVYFERIVGRCHNALGENASSDHDSLPEAIETHIKERDQKIASLYALQEKDTIK